MHLYDEKQADLDWTNEEVRNEFIQILNFWIKKGIRGFRFDVINNIDKEKFEDCPQGIGKQFYCDQPRVHDYLKELNTKTFRNVKNCITVGEMSSTSVKNCICYTNPDNHELNMVFSFHHLKVDYVNKEKWTSMPFDFKELKQLMNTWQVQMQEGNGWNALFWNCHDQPRSLSRFGDDKNYPVESAKMLATTLHMMRGTPYVYQGEEIGMTNHYFDSLEQYRDVESINAYNILKAEGKDEAYILKVLQEKSRDNARTPMQWDDSENAGFTHGEPWISVNDNYKDINVKNALNDTDSVFYHYKKLISLRKEYAVIQDGKYVPLLEEDDSIFAYKRVLDKEELLVISNFYGKECRVDLDLNGYEILLSNYEDSSTTNQTLRPYESIVLYK